MYGTDIALGAGDVVLQKTPSSFDVSVWEFFWPLMAGAALVMAPPEARRDRPKFCDYPRASRHHAAFRPLHARRLRGRDRRRAAAEAESLRHVFCSGEALSRELAETFEALFGAPLHNLYGLDRGGGGCDLPAGLWARRSPELETAGVPIGRPVWNTGVRVLDPWLRRRRSASRATSI